MKYFYRGIITFVMLFTLSGCFYNSVKGNGNIIVKNRLISDDFIRIEASSNIDVFLTESRDASLVVEADENLHELIQTTVEDGTLFISIKRKIWSAQAKKVHVSIQKLNEIVVTKGAELTSENTISAEDLNIIATGGAEINLHLNVNNLRCDGSSSADINLDGKARVFNVNSTTGSDVDAFGLNVLKCIAKASGGSDIKVYVKESFEGEASSGADIRFKGNPEIVNSNKSTAGKINKS